MSQESRCIKITFVGKDCVGKTSIISQIINNTFDEEYNATIGARYCSKRFYLDNETNFIFDIWDTTGKIEYRQFNKFFLKNTYAVILVYDITQQKSLDEIKNIYFPMIQENCHKDIIIAIAANKYDLDGNNNADEEDALEFAEKINAIYCHISAKNNIGIDDLFNKILKKIYEKEKMNGNI